MTGAMITAVNICIFSDDKFKSVLMLYRDTYRTYYISVGDEFVMDFQSTESEATRKPECP